jgi:hypothetical protein
VSPSQSALDAANLALEQSKLKQLELENQATIPNARSNSRRLKKIDKQRVDSIKRVSGVYVSYSDSNAHPRFTEAQRKKKEAMALASSPVDPTITGQNHTEPSTSQQPAHTGSDTPKLIGFIGSPGVADPNTADLQHAQLNLSAAHTVRACSRLIELIVLLVRHLHERHGNVSDRNDRQLRV